MLFGDLPELLTWGLPAAGGTAVRLVSRAGVTQLFEEEQYEGRIEAVCLSI